MTCSRAACPPATPNGARTSSPVGVPYHYGFPLLVYSVILHWAVSQTPFSDQVNVRAPNSTPERSRRAGHTLATMIWVVPVMSLLVLLACMGPGRFLAHISLVETTRWRTMWCVIRCSETRGRMGWSRNRVRCAGQGRGRFASDSGRGLRVRQKIEGMVLHITNEG